MKKIAEFILKSITPTSISSQDTQEVDYHLRPTELRGVLAWFLRAFMGGVALDANYDEVEAASKIQEIVFGSVNRSSSVSIKVHPIDNTIIVDKRKLSLNPRYKLLTMGNRRVTFADFKEQRVEVYLNVVGIHKDKDNFYCADLVKLIISNFVISIILGGFGKGSRRGFGSFIVKNVRLYLEDFHLDKSSQELINKLINLVYQLADNNLEDLNKILKNLQNLLDISYKIHEDFFIKYLKNHVGKKKGSYPNIPVFSKLFSCVDLVLVNKEKVDDRTLFSPLDIIQALMQRSYYDKKYKRMYKGLPAILQGVYNNPKFSAKKLQSFILGLPRQATISIKLDIEAKELKKLEKIKRDLIKSIENKLESLKNDNSFITKEVEREVINELKNKIKEDFINFIKYQDDFKRGYKMRIITGYIHTSIRRASPLIISALKFNYNMGIFTLAKFSSIDWPNPIIWVSLHRDKSPQGHHHEIIIQVYLINWIRGLVKELACKQIKIDGKKIFEEDKCIDRKLRTFNLNFFNKLIYKMQEYIKQVFSDCKIDVYSVWPKSKS